MTIHYSFILLKIYCKNKKKTYIWQVILRGRDIFSAHLFLIISYMLKNKIKSLPLKTDLRVILFRKKN
jgi:hypothetical protein